MLGLLTGVGGLQWSASLGLILVKRLRTCQGLDETGDDVIDAVDCQWLVSRTVP